MRILIADDQVTLRSAIRRVLKEKPDLDVVAEATNLGELFRCSRNQQPDVILLDWELSGFPSAAISLAGDDPKRIKSEQRRNVIILSLHSMNSHPFVIVFSSHPEVKKAALKSGADAFILKGDSPEKFINVLYSFSKLD